MIGNLPEEAEVRVFTVSGELVDSLSHRGGSSLRWRKAENVASGVYILLVTYGGEVKNLKFAVVR